MKRTNSVGLAIGVIVGWIGLLCAPLGSSGWSRQCRWSDFYPIHERRFAPADFRVFEACARDEISALLLGLYLAVVFLISGALVARLGATFSLARSALAGAITATTGLLLLLLTADGGLAHGATAAVGLVTLAAATLVSCLGGVLVRPRAHVHIS